MAADRRRQVVRFGTFELDPETGDLWKRGRRIRLQNQPRQILRLLVSRPGELVAREELRRQLWPEDTYVDFDNSLNIAVRKIRDALGDLAPSPRFIETERAHGYRFIAPVAVVTVEADGVAHTPRPSATAMPAAVGGIPATADAVVAPVRLGYRRWAFAATWIALPMALAALTGVMIFPPAGTGVPRRIAYTQLTNFTDSAVAPALSPDGRMVAFFRSDQWFLTPDQVWVKMLPDGEPVQLTYLPQAKYSLSFSPDGNRIAFTMAGVPGWRTLTVSPLGGEPTLLLQNAAGLSWIDSNRVLFSEIRTGLHMGIATSAENRSSHRRIYFPVHERAMAHFSLLSPDRQWVLVVEMDHASLWQRCRVVPFDGKGRPREVGPHGACTAAAWSPDGDLMYFTAIVNGSSHLWRQRFPHGEPEQLTFGPNEEDGIAMFPDGRSLVTAIGVRQSVLWMHDERGERAVTSEGYVETGSGAQLQFSRDGEHLFYLLRRSSLESTTELWQMDVDSGANRLVLAGFPIIEFDVSPLADQVLFSTEPSGSASQMWLASLEARSPPVPVGHSGDASPRFGREGEIVFRMTEGAVNYLAAMRPDGSGRRKLSQRPVANVHHVSPDGRWVTALAPISDRPGDSPSTVAVDVQGGAIREICPTLCFAIWAPDGKRLYVNRRRASRNDQGETFVIPLTDGQMVEFPPGGLRGPDDVRRIPGASVIGTGPVVPAPGAGRYAFVKMTMNRNLFQVTVPP